MASLSGIEKIEYINILTKEGNATLDIFLKFCKRKDQKTVLQAVVVQATDL